MTRGCSGSRRSIGDGPRGDVLVGKDLFRLRSSFLLFAGLAGGVGYGIAGARLRLVLLSESSGTEKGQRHYKKECCKRSESAHGTTSGPRVATPKPLDGDLF